MFYIIGENPQGRIVPNEKRFWIRRPSSVERGNDYLHNDLVWHNCVWSRTNEGTKFTGLYESEEEAKNILRKWEHLDKLGENAI
jgi:hypothetical protein